MSCMTDSFECYAVVEIDGGGIVVFDFESLVVILAVMCVLGFEKEIFGVGGCSYSDWKKQCACSKTFDYIYCWSDQKPRRAHYYFAK